MASDANASFPFLDLPRFLQEGIYDLLLIEDRIMLNAALPRDSKIIKTKNTDVIKDRYLAVIRYKTKVQQTTRTPVVLSPQQSKFVKENRCDPTIREFIKTMKITNLSNDINLTLPNELLSHIGSNNVSPTHDYVIDQKKITRNDINVLLGVVCKYATPATFDIMFHNKTTMLLVQRFMLRRESTQHKFMVDLLSAGNTALFEHLISDNEHEYFIMTSSCKDYLAEVARTTFHDHPVARGLLLKHIQLSQITKRKMLETVMNNMDHEGFHQLIAHGARL